MTDLNLHAMAVPDSTPLEALRRAGDWGFAGLELIIDDDYRCAVAVSDSAARWRQLRSCATDLGLAIPVVSSYQRGLGHGNDAQRAAARGLVIAELDLAAELGASGLRILAGAPATGVTPALVEDLATLADRSPDVDLLIENHMGTAVETVAATVDLARRVDRPRLGVIADPANLELCVPGSSWLVRAQLPWTRHLHVKDFRRGASIDERHPVIPGDGDVPWPMVLALLAAEDCRPSMTFEYEARWFADLPPVASVAATVIDRMARWAEEAGATKPPAKESSP